MSTLKKFSSTKARASARRVNQRRLKFWKHQKQTLRLCQQSPIVYDTSDPGTGKTRVHLAAFDKRRGKGGGSALILAPKTLLQSAWGRELEECFPHLSFSIAYAKNREKAFAIPADVYITNVDAAKWLAAQKPAFFDRFDTLIIDEITAYKHRTSQRSKAIAKIVKHFKYRSGLTGTPNSNTILDVWHQMYLLDGGQRLGSVFSKFRLTVCEPQQVGPLPEHIAWVDRDGAEAAVASCIDDITVRHRFEDCMDIPPNFVHTVPFRMSKPHRKVYEEMAANAITKLKSGEVIDAVHAAALQTKLLQIASGAVYDEQHSYHVIDTGRYEMILDLIGEREHSVTFFNWRHQRELLTDGAEKRGFTYAVVDGTTPDRDREDIVAAYQDGAYRTLFLHPRTGAHGLTLTRGTATIWSSPIYEADSLKQGLHRIYRGGQTKRTETLLVAAENSVEQRVYEVLRKKTTKMVNLLTLLQE